MKKEDLKKIIREEIISEMSSTNVENFYKYMKSAKSELFKLYNITQNRNIIRLWKELETLNKKIQKTISNI